METDKPVKFERVEKIDDANLLQPDMTLPPVTEGVSDFADDTSDATYANPDAVRGTPDDKGKPFDPTLHVFPPEKTATGRWKKIPKSERPERSDAEQMATPNAAYRREAAKVATMYAQLHTLALGPDAGILSEQDLVPMIDAWEAKYNEDGLKQMSPNLQIALTSFLYTLGVTQRPTIKERLTNLWYKLRKKKKPQKPEKAKADEID